MKRRPNPPAPYEELDLNDQVIWSENYKSLNSFEQFKTKMIASAICYVRELKDIDCKTVTADQLIEYVKNGSK
jgi:hypothetical protein